ncbi:hypothetical protein [Arthrobacter burdickii]|uniref:Uncharacterized protein n=1 Tax=Arthrobacter burdickii TaxID=3035920 RepID=A0ABT8K332_9MICC|nr:hypothetical protein [Arthrobacter burdickii]MDN4610784.1 hypothetical protein [Arthrobacter burdickii]
MSFEDLDRVVAAARKDTAAVHDDLSASIDPPEELQSAVASAISNGESLAAVAAIADLSPLAALDVLERHSPQATPASSIS